MSGWTLREIDQLWQDELFPPAEDPEPVGGQRVTRFQGYLNQVDWTDAAQVTRALRVFEVVLRQLLHPPVGYVNVDALVSRIRRLLERDGYQLHEDGRLTGGPTVVIAEDFLANLTEPTVIHEHLDRISHAIERDDPAQAIGSAKELVESTAKLVLRERGETYSDSDDVPELVRRAQIALDVHPSGHAPGPDGSDAVKKILGATVAVTAGLTELRNRGYGTGHGPGAARTGLGRRHARLAINAAKTWCEFMLDTLSDDEAPWQRKPPAV
ncbi:abortive infection family protein [Blastococcus sp. KM273128]|uniref:abortive infection family protein n=1 Tax=Blastococcus sp. KM273128 TaxID=2570314 RepID=UPI001F47A4AF|nr:abortive infection family protein [Blastococcus sp. KM273128]